ncbi:MAG: glycosyltransferase [Clostridia bacterium]|nr:glycosyltransferase [Clostridia bacterium]
MKILEITEFDLYGRGFNGYDLMKQINRETSSTAKMAALRKISDDSDVIPILKKEREILLCDELRYQESRYLNVMSVLSVSSPALYELKEYKEADIVHYHQFHNSNFGFFELEREAKRKPTVISFHDPWMLTGRCVHPGGCRKYAKGCIGCERLGTLFPFGEDMSAAMWKIKRDMFAASDPDIIVHSEYMYDLVKENPYTKDLNVHLIPFGIDVSEFTFKKTKAEARESLGIPEGDFVLFFRAQADFKGTSYIVDALKRFEDPQSVTLLACSQTGLLDEISDRFNIIELGNVQSEVIKECFNACDVFLMPSIGESFGLMALEAMAAGKPVVVFDNTALPWVTNAPEVGVLVKNLDSEDLYEKIKWLYDDKDERIRRGEAGRELAKSRYSPDEYKRKMNEVYSAAAERQKYKLQKRREESTPDINDIEVRKLVFHLNGIFKRTFGKSGGNIKLLSAVSEQSCDAHEIDYENKNVKEAVMLFNAQCRRFMRSKKPFLFLRRKIKGALRRAFGLLKRIAKKIFK